MGKKPSRLAIGSAKVHIKDGRSFNILLKRRCLAPQTLFYGLKVLTWSEETRCS